MVVSEFSLGTASDLLLTCPSSTDPRTYTTAPRTEGELDGLSSAERRIAMLSEAVLPQCNEDLTRPRELEIARWNMEQFFSRDHADESWHRFYDDVHRAQMRLVSLVEDVEDPVSCWLF